MSSSTRDPATEGLTRRPNPPDLNPKTVTGYAIETDLEGKTDIVLTLRKGGMVALRDLQPPAALLYLKLLEDDGRRIFAVWDPRRDRLMWTKPDRDREESKAAPEDEA